jgi:hypothetical protein
MTAASPPRAAIITLTTDFGTADPYVAAMKGVLLSINPMIAIVDISHEVRPQRLPQALFLTQSAWPFFPDGAIHVVVVDPGVGTQRRALALQTPRGCFVGPDNGVLSSALPEEARPSDDAGPATVELPAGWWAVAITERRYLREPVSATFHGRDVFAPAAAHLSRGVPLEELGPPVEALLCLPPLRAQRRRDGTLAGRVLHIDRFGNAITDIRAEDLPPGRFAIEIAGRQVGGPVRAYAEATGPAALVGSGGYLEIALPSGSAAAELGIEVEAPVALRPAR